MKTEAQRIAIAQACGWKRVWESAPANYWATYSPNGLLVTDEDPGAKEWETHLLPNYPADLNAMHEAWQCLGWEEKNECVEHLKAIVKEADCEVFFATAAQRAEAFLRTLNLWTDDQPSEI